MKASELRIGNEISIGTVTAISDNMVSFDDGDLCGMLDIKELHPIPITPEWLLKFGFDVGEDWGTIKIWINELHINLRLKTFTINLSGDDSEVLFECDNIDYVHQVQNLYFALSGEELTIKETVK